MFVVETALYQPLRPFDPEARVPDMPPPLKALQNIDFAYDDSDQSGVNNSVLYE